MVSDLFSFHKYSFHKFSTIYIRQSTKDMRPWAKQACWLIAYKSYQPSSFLKSAPYNRAYCHTGKEGPQLCQQNPTNYCLKHTGLPVRLWSVSYKCLSSILPHRDIPHPLPWVCRHLAVCHVTSGCLHYHPLIMPTHLMQFLSKIPSTSPAIFTEFPSVMGLQLCPVPFPVPNGEPHAPLQCTWHTDTSFVSVSNAMASISSPKVHVGPHPPPQPQMRGCSCTFCKDDVSLVHIHRVPHTLPHAVPLPYHVWCHATLHACGLCTTFLCLSSPS